MNININYYGHNVDIDPEDVAERLPRNPSDEEIKSLLTEMIEEALSCDPASFTHDGEDVITRVKEILKEREAEEDE